MNNLTQPAYPVVPLQDNFKRLVVPIPGLSKFEHFALEIYKARLSNNIDDSNIELMNYAIIDAIDFLNKIEEKTKTLTNDKNDEVVIYNH
jgi:hypothetical protein|tara:strand:- start:6095 stop:6364 length:270 start_codon:yes stop_codon:yes gene_type:complete